MSMPTWTRYHSPGTASASPITTAKAVWTAHSPKITRSTWVGAHPIAFNTPNSRIRSKTAISIALRMRMPMAM